LEEAFSNKKSEEYRADAELPKAAEIIQAN